MLRRVALVRTDVSDEPSTSFIRVTRISELGTMLVLTSSRHTLRRNISSILHSHRRENVKSYMTLGAVCGATLKLTELYEAHSGGGGGQEVSSANFQWHGDSYTWTTRGAPSFRCVEKNLI
jgi:hypothetical protein